MYSLTQDGPYLINKKSTYGGVVLWSSQLPLNGKIVGLTLARVNGFMLTYRWVPVCTLQLLLLMIRYALLL
jgi:hypothetical protein